MTRIIAVSAPARDEGVPMCTRHTHPCKLLTVKRNNEGNKGRKLYVCCMPRGDQCGFFKWEEDTVKVSSVVVMFLHFEYPLAALDLVIDDQ